MFVIFLSAGLVGVAFLLFLIDSARRIEQGAPKKDLLPVADRQWSLQEFPSSATVQSQTYEDKGGSIEAVAPVSKRFSNSSEAIPAVPPATDAREAFAIEPGLKRGIEFALNSGGRVKWIAEDKSAYGHVFVSFRVERREGLLCRRFKYSMTKDGIESRSNEKEACRGTRGGWIFEEDGR
jgi:hypothetical protein